MTIIMETTTLLSLLRPLRQSNLSGSPALKITKGGMHDIPPFFHALVRMAASGTLLMKPHATEAARSVMACCMSAGPKEEVPQTKRFAPCCLAMGAVFV